MSLYLKDEVCSQISQAIGPHVGTSCADFCAAVFPQATSIRQDRIMC